MIIYEFPIWLFILFITLLCFSLSIYLTCHRKKAGVQAVSGQKQRLPRQTALVLGASGQPRLPLLRFCPACGKQTDMLRRTHTCGFCGHTLEPVSRHRQTRMFSNHSIDLYR